MDGGGICEISIPGPVVAELGLRTRISVGLLADREGYNIYNVPAAGQALFYPGI
jgi:hypothetical protein